MNIAKKIILFFLIYSTQIFTQTVPVTLHYKPIIDQFTTLRLVGNFNGWNNNDPAMVMTDSDGDGVYEITKDFATGVEHMYKFVFDANWSFAWNDPDNPQIKLTDNNNSILNVTDPFITYLLPRGVNSAGNMYVDTTVTGEPIRAIFAYTVAKSIDLNSLSITIDNVVIENPSQYYIEEKKELFYQPPIALSEGEHTVVVSVSSAAGTATKTSTFMRTPGLTIYKAPMDFYYDENNTGSSVIQNINSVALVGDFNNWNELFDPMQDNNNDGLWEVTSYLEKGNYEYKFKLNNSLWINDPDEPIFSASSDNNIFTVVIDSIPSIKLISPNESTTFTQEGFEVEFKALLRAGVKSNGIDNNSILVDLDGSSVAHTFSSDSSIVNANIILNGEGNHLVSISFSNKEGLLATASFAYGLNTKLTGYYYADAINDEPYSYPSGVAQGSADIISLLIDEVPTHDSLVFSVSLKDITDRSRVGLIITNPVSTSTDDPLLLDILTENWENEGIFIPIGAPGNAYENQEKENKVWLNLSSFGKQIKINSNALNSNKIDFTISLAYLDSLLGSWTRERNFYLFSYLANEDKSGNSFEVNSAEGGSDELEDPDIYDAAFFRSGFWQSKIFANYIPSDSRMGPRFVSLSGDGRGRKPFQAGDISDSLETYGPAITFLTPSVTYWYSDVTVKGTLSDPEITNLIFSFNGNETTENVVDSQFSIPVKLVEGDNIIFIKATDSKGFESTSKNLVLTFVKNHEPEVKIVGSVEGRSVTLTAEAASPDSLTFTYYWTDDDKINPANVMGASANQTINFNLPQNEGEYYINVRARDSQGRLAYARQMIFAKNDSVYLADLNDHSAWIDDAIFYEIYPRSYSSSSNFHGIQNKIPEMVDLGINAVWLMPIYKGPTIHGYEITDYYDFEENYGNAEDFKNLVKAFHEAGIKVVLDFVVNHTSIQHSFMQNALEYGTNSPWAIFYIWDGEPGNSNYEYFFDWASLPNLNHNNIDVRKYFINVAKYWVQQFDIDGYRCDVAWGVEQRNSDFWQEWRTALKNIKPELFLEAEASSGESVYYQNRFDSANDWDLRNKILNVTNGTLAIDVLDAELRKSYPIYARPFRFLENHDEVRVASSYNTKRSKMMHTILMTSNGIPLIYSGGEVGEKTNRDIIDWSDPDSLTPYFKSIINIRKKYLANPVLTRLTTSLPSDVYAYISTSGNNNILTIVNFKSTGKNTSINIGDLPVGTKYLTNLIDGSVIDIQPISGSVFIDLNSFEAKVFYLGEEPVSVESNQTNDFLIDEFKLFQNYPNPFNPTTKISFQLPKPSIVTLKIYDVLGREIETLLNKEMKKGKFDINFNASNLSSGVYFYRLQFGNLIETKKLLLIK
ncbi:MAG: alpha-amylase family glycosyl hydrolase [Melioribacteraceae bacterium]